MVLGQAAEGDVREGADEVQVADDGEPAGRRRQLAELIFPGSRGGRGRRRRSEAACDEEYEKWTEEQERDY